MNRIGIDVNNILQVLEVYSVIKIYRGDSSTGPFSEITTPSTRIPLVAEKEQYYYDDLAGVNTHWYKTSYYNPDTVTESDMSAALKGGTVAERVGYTFGNYTPPAGEWGKIYTADDMRYTMMFGIDCVGSDIAASEFTNEQFDQLILEAVSEFEAYLTTDIRRKRYMTFAARERTTEVRGRLWRAGVDFTDEDDPYDFSPQEWGHFGFIQLRHWPILNVFRAKWYSPVRGEIMDMLANKWLRIDKQFGQLRMFPTGGFTYGPYSVYGPLWTGQYAMPYPGAFEFDYETGFESADFVPDAMRAVIAKYAAIKCLAVIGDGLLAGFSSQSISLDGLSESFSSTQSATSAYFGARIVEYQKEISEWLARNRYKFAPIPISFVGA